MTTEDVDAILDTLESYYPGKFSEFPTATFTLWRQELGQTSLDTVLAAIRRWVMTHQHQYAPTLTSLLMLVDELEDEARRYRAQTRVPGTDPALPALLQQAEAAYIANAQDDATALYGRLMGSLAQRVLRETLSQDDLAAQCQVWAAQYPLVAEWMQQAARQFVGDTVAA